MVIDSTDRERLSITKEELYKMLNNEVRVIDVIIVVKPSGGGF